jgi:hypothetical protein
MGYAGRDVLFYQLPVEADLKHSVYQLQIMVTCAGRQAFFLEPCVERLDLMPSDLI